MGKEELDRLERALLVHLLDHRGQQVRFEADQWTTEFGIFRAFGQDDQGTVKVALRSLEMSRYVYRRVQYVIGYSEPKLVYSLTPSGHRKAIDLHREASGAVDLPAPMPMGAQDPEPDLSTFAPPAPSQDG
jgi:DNA-binding PadR family transcriptional regulator